MQSSSVSSVERLKIPSDAPARAQKALIDLLPQTVWSMPIAGGPMFASRSIEPLTGFTLPEIATLQRNLWIDRAHPDDRSRIARACGQDLAGGHPLEVEYRFQRKDGTWIWLRSRTSVRFDFEGVRVDGVVSDVTENRRLRDEVVSLQKMEAVGQVAGGIAHDLRNLLTIILGSGHLLQESVRDNGEICRDVEAILDAGARASFLLAQLLGFSQPSACLPGKVNLSNVVEDLAHLLNRAVREDIDFSLDLAERMPDVAANRPQIEQVITNLVINARDAMPHGGALSIATRSVILPAEGAGPLSRAAAPGRYCVLSVRDNGCGMDPATLQRVFEPYFSTKSTGTGLGLATCARIVSAMGGFIDVRSEMGHGSDFSVYLPATDAVRAAAQKTPALPESDARGSETVLVVEDDPGVLTLVRRMLEKLGYRVLGASTVQQALAAFEAHTSEIDVVICDVIIPELNGPEIIKRLLSVSSRTKALFMSGHTDHALFRDGRLQGSPNFIQKPFDAAALARKIRAVLDA